MKLFLLTFMLVLALTDNPPQQPVIGIYTQDA